MRLRAIRYDCRFACLRWQRRSPRQLALDRKWGWCPVGRVGVVAGTARGSAGEVSSTSLDRSHGDPPPYRGRAVKRHDETRPTANSAGSSSRSSRSTICGHRGEHPMKTTDIEYRDGALTCRGFLAYDETKTG